MTLRMRMWGKRPRTSDYNFKKKKYKPKKNYNKIKITVQKWNILLPSGCVEGRVILTGIIKSVEETQVGRPANLQSPDCTFKQISNILLV